MEPCSCYVVWLINKGITRHFKLFPCLANNIPLTLFYPFFPLSSTKAWVLASNPLGTFYLGFPHPCLYACISSALRWEVYLSFWLPFDRLAHDPFNVASWHLLLIFLQWCIFLPLHGGAIDHRDIRTCLWLYLRHNWEEIQMEHVIWVQALAMALSPHFDPPW